MTEVAIAPLTLALSGIRKSFGPTEALQGLDLQVRAGEILGITGPNGAGKSTLVRILAGEESRDAGQILVGGRAWEPGDPTDRVAVVHQEPQVWTNLSLGENLVVGRESFRLGRPRLTTVERQILRELEIDGFVSRPLGECSLATRQRAEIARAIAQDARYFLFDEPNSALTEEESDRLFAYIHDLARRGRIVILVTHRLAEIVAHCARVVVIRDGRVTAEFDAADLTEEAIARELVVGTTVAEDRERGRLSASTAVERPRGHTAATAAMAATMAMAATTATPARERPVLVLRSWSHPAGLFRDVDLDVDRGEIVAAVGVEGSGARELVASTAGYAPGIGHRTIGGSGDDRAIARGSAYLPADRRGSLFGNLSVADNLVIRLGVPEIATWGGFLRLARMRTLASRLVARFGVRTRAPAAPLGSLSGGNQQKVAIAAAIAREPTLLVVEEPTRGVDVGATGDIYGILRQFTAAGGGVLVYCTEVPEVFELADRAVVVDRGRANRMIRVSDHPDVASLAAAIARSEHTLVTVDDLVASHAPIQAVAGGSAAHADSTTSSGPA